MSVSISSSVSVVAILAGVSGCAAQTALLPGYQERASSLGIRIVDDRPDEDKSTEHLSLLITSCDYGIRRLGDEKTVPPRLTLLRQDLETALGPQIANATVRVSRYRIFFNRGAALRGQTNAQYQGLIPALLSNAGSRCPKDETSGGWYAASEAKTPHSPLIVEVEGAVGAKRFAVRVVHSTNNEFAGAFGDPEAAAALFGAMRQATAVVIEQIRAGNGPPP
jgi:hypothetical protein